MATIIDKFFSSNRVGRRIGGGFFSECYANSATTVTVRAYTYRDAFAKLLTGIALNSYFQKHFGIDYLLGVKVYEDSYLFLVRKLDTSFVPAWNDDKYEQYFHNHEIGTLFKAYFYPYIRQNAQKYIDEIWLDAKDDNSGYYKGHLILFDSITSTKLADDKIRDRDVFKNLLDTHNIAHKGLYDDNL